MRIFNVFLMTLLAVLAFGPAPAQLPPEGRNAVAVSLVPEARTVAPGGSIWLAILMEPDPGWHGYWKNPGDSGVGTSVEWELPAGVETGELLYPVPDRLIVAGLMNYVYEGDYAHLVKLSVPGDAQPGARIPVRGKIDYLTCTKEVCVPESALLAADLRVGPAAAPAPSNADFDAHLARLPQPLGQEGRFAAAGKKLRIAIPLAEGMEIEEPYFFPLTDGAIEYNAPQRVTRSGDWILVEAAAGRDAERLETIEGVLKIGEHSGLALTARPGELPMAAAAANIPAGQQGMSGGIGAILTALGGAILGGLILNIMPCVFPILSLKALGLAKAGGGERAARRDGLFYALGAVAVALALGGLILGLRAGGEAVGWAFQLQDPRVILLLLLLVTAIALNLAGLFELPSFAFGGRLTRGEGAGPSFWTGALAAFIATPCTGPFMGAALGAALVLPPLVGLAIFAGLGFGLALPFLALGFIPALRRLLPEPGPWLGTFRRLMALPMFATALALAWLLGRQAGVDGMALGLGAAVLLGVMLWWLGRRSGRAWLPLASAVAAAVAAFALIPTAGEAPARADSVAAGLDAEPFSETRLAELRRQGRPAFVYFTADWCVTCKVNERTALADEEVAAAFAAAGIAVLAGDWTRRDPEISRFIERHGRSGVPLYLFYPPGKQPRILPQILTPGRLVGLTLKGDTA
ncbi:MAG: protein-disulfide reductase DsbD family protein [Sphingomonadaceae bacterium]